MNLLNTAQIGRFLACGALALATGAVAASGWPEQDQVRLAPFVATPPDVVERMLSLAKVGPGDVVYDLGCGDGRIVIAAAKRFGARGVGIDLDPNLIQTAQAAAAREGVSDRVEFRVGNVLEADVSKASVVALYLLAASNIRLRPQLVAQLAPGARIVAHNFGMGDWEPDAVDTFRDASGASRTLYLWTIDGRVKP
jgi:protein-L-isoaspartate O-methyltransferase